MAFFGLKLGLDLEKRAANPHQKFQGVPPPPRDFTEGLPPVVSSYDFNLISANVGMFKVVFALNASQNSY